jgi:hypothetical protein
MNTVQITNQLSERLMGELGVHPSDVKKHSKEIAKAATDGDVIVIIDGENNAKTLYIFCPEATMRDVMYSSIDS